MEDLAAELEGDGFLRIQKSYLVNMTYIKKFNYDRVILLDGKAVSYTHLDVYKRQGNTVRPLFVHLRHHRSAGAVGRGYRICWAYRKGNRQPFASGGER